MNAKVTGLGGSISTSRMGALERLLAAVRALVAEHVDSVIELPVADVALDRKVRVVDAQVAFHIRWVLEALVAEAAHMRFLVAVCQPMAGAVRTAVE